MYESGSNPSTFLEWQVSQALLARCLLKLGCPGVWECGAGLTEGGGPGAAALVIDDTVQVELS